MTDFIYSVKGQMNPLLQMGLVILGELILGALIILVLMWIKERREKNKKIYWVITSKKKAKK